MRPDWLEKIYRKMDRQRAAWVKYDRKEITLQELFWELRK